MTCVLLGQLELAHPARLLALMLLPALLYFAIFFGEVAGRRKRIVLFICRAAILALLIFAWTQPQWRGPTTEKYVVFVDDVSASVQGAAREEAQRLVSAATDARGRHRAAYVAFGERPGPIAPAPPSDTGEISPLASDPAAAVLLAAGSIPGGFVPEVVLLSDGNETAGELFAAAQSGVPTSVVPLQSFSSPEVAIRAILGPHEVPRDRPIALEIFVDANGEAEGRLRLTRQALDETTMSPVGDVMAVANETIRLKEGVNRFWFSAKMDSGAPAVFHATIEADRDTAQQNNRRSKIVFQPEPFRTLVVSGDASNSDHIGSFLANSPFEVVTVTPAELAKAAVRSWPFDLIILAGVADSAIGDSLQAGLSKYVNDGGGLIVAGGEAPFRADEFQGSGLEKLSPVRAAPALPVERRNIALLLVIDKSTSMREQNRMTLAKQAARRTVDLDLLTAEDKVGILAFGDTAEWISPIVPCDDKAELKRRIDQLEAEGRTNMFPAMQRALLALSEAHTDRRHLILLTDGVPSPGEFEDITRQMIETGITISTVSVGAGADQTILKDIARLAGGRHVHCQSAEQLSEKLVAEARTAAAPEAAAYEPIVYRQLPGLNMTSAPPLGEYASTGPKRQTELLLLVGAADPLVAWWRYGAGVVVAITSEDTWGENWRKWSGSAEFWQRLANHARRKRRPQNYDLRLARTGGETKIVLDTTRGDGRFLNDAAPRLAVQATGAIEPEARTMPQTAPGRYASALPITEEQSYGLTATWRENASIKRQVRRAIVRDYAEEWQLQPTAEPLLRDAAAVSGGTFSPAPEQIFADSPRTVIRVTALWRTCVLAALLLFVFDVGLRRWLYESA